jgi:hypothetical protein
VSELLTYISLGFHHIRDFAAADHILFLLALAAVYRVSHWRPALGVITAFTVGHSLTLGLAVTGLLRFPTGLIELLIPVTIVLTCIENLRGLRRADREERAPVRAGLALIFGLVHGAGFANYLNAMFMDRIALPLFGFNLGIEAGQLLILVVAAGVFAVADYALAEIRRAGFQPFRLRVAAVSLVIAILASRMVFERVTW